jgi:hypothetical protein
VRKEKLAKRINTREMGPSLEEWSNMFEKEDIGELAQQVERERERERERETCVCEGERDVCVREKYKHGSESELQQIDKRGRENHVSYCLAVAGKRAFC